MHIINNKFAVTINLLYIYFLKKISKQRSILIFSRPKILEMFKVRGIYHVKTMLNRRSVFASFSPEMTNRFTNLGSLLCNDLKFERDRRRKEYWLRASYNRALCTDLLSDFARSIITSVCEACYIIENLMCSKYTSE